MYTTIAQSTMQLVKPVNQLNSKNRKILVKTERLYSTIDFLCISNSLKQYVVGYEHLDCPLNHSDHRAVSLNLSMLDTNESNPNVHNGPWQLRLAVRSVSLNERSLASSPRKYMLHNLCNISFASTSCDFDNLVVMTFDYLYCQAEILCKDNYRFSSELSLNSD